MTRQSSFAPGGGPDCPDAIGRPVVDAHQLASDPDWAPLWSQDGVAPSQLLTGSRQAERHLLEPEYGTQRRPHPPDHRSRPAADAALLQKRQRLALRFLLFRYVVFYIIQQVAQTSAKVSNIQQGTSGDSIKRVEIFVGLLLSAAKCRATQIGFPNKWHFFFFLFLSFFPPTTNRWSTPVSPFARHIPLRHSVHVTVAALLLIIAVPFQLSSPHRTFICETRLAVPSLYMYLTPLTLQTSSATHCASKPIVYNTNHLRFLIIPNRNPHSFLYNIHTIKYNKYI